VENPEQDKLEYWESIDVYDDEPSSKINYVTYCVWFPYDKLPKPIPSPYRNFVPYLLFINVDETNVATIADNSMWFGKLAGDMTWEQRKEIYEFLYEWEFIKKVNIGPEQYEWFATKKLTDG
jgi:hypothetical protein